MRLIGIRVAPKETHFCIIESNEHPEVLVNDKVLTPRSLSLPEQLQYMRNTFHDIIIQNKIQRAGIRITESSADLNRERVSIEAVLVEMLASSSVEHYFLGQISNITAKIGIPRRDFLLMILRHGKSFERIENWDSYDSESKEAILVGLASQTI